MTRAKTGRFAAFATALLLLYALGLLLARRGITTDTGDALAWLSNAYRLAGDETFTFNVARPPAGSWLLLPLALSAEPLAGLALAQAGMSLLCAAVVAGIFAGCRRRWGDWPALAAAAAFALNPVVVRYAHSVQFDIAGAVAFLAAALSAGRLAAAPSARSFAAAAALCAAAMLVRYQFCLAVLGPAAACLLLRRPRWPSALLGLAALPALGYAACLAAAAAAPQLAGEPAAAGIAGLRQAHRLLIERVLAPNLPSAASMPAAFYLRALEWQLGLPLAALAAHGLVRWLRSGRIERIAAALSMLLPIAALSALGGKEGRYLLSLLPLASAAFAESLEALRVRFGTRAALSAAVAALALPAWRGADNAAQLLREASLRSPVYAELGRAVAAAVPPGGCLFWKGPALYFAYSTGLGTSSEPQIPALSANDLALYARRRTSNGPRAGGRPGGPLCAARLETSDDREGYLADPSAALAVLRDAGGRPLANVRRDRVEPRAGPARGKVAVQILDGE